MQHWRTILVLTIIFGPVLLATLIVVALLIVTALVSLPALVGSILTN